MCGIFGFIRTAPAGKSQIDFMADSFVAGQLRGPHGSGIMVVGPKHQVVGYTEPITGADFIRHEGAFDTLKSIGGSLAAVGHNRFTTSGQNIADHCHPFQFGEIMGVHNGGLPEHVLHEIDPKVSHPVDSARLYAALSRTDNPIEVLEQISAGAYALVWYNSKTQTVYMARNWERPLHVIQSVYGVYFASEGGMLQWVAGRNNLFSANDKMASLNTETLYSFPLKDLSATTATKYTPKVYKAPWKEPQSYKGVFGYDYPYYPEYAQPYLPALSVDPYHTYFTLTHVETMHPELRSTVDRVRRNIVDIPRAVIPALNVMLLGRATNMDGMLGMAGFIVVPNKNAVEYRLPVFVKLSYQGYLSHFANMLPKGAATLESIYPVITCLIDKFQVLATGEMVVVTHPASMSEPTQLLNQVSPETVVAAIQGVENTELDAMTDEQILGLWKSSRKAATAAN